MILRLAQRIMAYNIVVTYSESDHWTYAEYRQLKKRLNRADRFKVVAAIAEGKRYVSIQNGTIEHIQFI